MRRILVPNRGEIALRIDRACEVVGLECVIALSEVDASGYVARKARKVAALGPGAPQESYLHTERILGVAVKEGCDAIHPGYGFLAEDANFAQAVIDAGLTYIGPRPESMRLLGGKAAARQVAAECGIPTILGSEAGLNDGELLERAESLGYPVIVKAVAGGGGRGMRIARSSEELRAALPRARGEALKFFNNDQLFLERYLENIRHIEVQICGDRFGKVLHFGTRDCSIQRRHQKLVEEAPAPFLSESLRTAIHNAAVTIASHVQYENAGTVEFLVSGEEFFFTEVNTRIQVEHPVTEAVTGCDLVALQLKIAAGEPLPWTQEEVVTKGHAIELRLTAEDPFLEMAPSVGRIEQFEVPAAEFLRHDRGYEAGDEVPRFYDSLLSKLIVSGATREEALRRAEWVVSRSQVQGIATLLPFFQWLLRYSSFRYCAVLTRFLGDEFQASAIQQLLRGDLVDPLWRAGCHGAEVVEQQRLYIDDGLLYADVHIRHRRDKVFVVTLMGEVKSVVEQCEASSGSAPPARRTFASNSLATALAALRAELVGASLR